MFACNEIYGVGSRQASPCRPRGGGRGADRGHESRRAHAPRGTASGFPGDTGSQLSSQFPWSQILSPAHRMRGSGVGMWATPRPGRDATRTTLQGPRPLGASHDRLGRRRGDAEEVAWAAESILRGERGGGDAPAWGLSPPV